MRTTFGNNYRMLSLNLEKLSSRLYSLREQAVTGKQMVRPSDNPSAIRPVLNYRIKSEVTDRYLDHIALAQGEMQVLDSTLDSIENIMVTAKEAGLAAANSSVSGEDRRTYAGQIAQLFDEMLQVSNTEVNGKHIFAGFKETTTPFTENTNYDPQAHDPADPSTWAVTYQGDGNGKTVEIAPEKRIRTGLPGNELFLGDVDNDGSVDSGGFDLFTIMKNFENAIRTNDTAAISQGIDLLEKGADQVRRIRGEMGNNGSRIERANAYLSDVAVEFKEIISKYEDADILQVLSQLVQQETAFEAALNVTTRVSKLSILDFM